MKLSVLANLYAQKSLDEALAIISGLGVHTVEIGAGGYPGNLHEEINNFSIIAGHFNTT